MEEEGRYFLKELIVGSKWIVVGLLGAVLLVYGNSLLNEFVSDDITSIVSNPYIGDLWKNMVSRASLTDGLKSLIYLVSGTDPLLYHLNNVLWHFAVSVMVYFVVGQLAFDRSLTSSKLLRENAKTIGVVAAFLFALHPIHTEAVTWVSGSPYLVSSLFFLLAFGLYVGARKDMLSKRWLWVSWGVSLVAYFSSEKTIVLPALIFGFELVYGGIKEAIKKIVPYILVLAAFFLTWQARFLVAVSERVGVGQVPFNPLIEAPLAILTYIKLLIWPLSLTLYHEAFRLDLIEVYINSLVFIALAMIGIFLFVKKQKFLFIMEALFFLGILPTLLPYNISWVVAERYVYLSSIGFLAVISAGMVWIKKKNELIFWVITIGLLSFYGVRTIARNGDWRNQDTLWPATVEVSPDSSIARNNMGDYYFRHGDLRKAAEEFSKAIELRQNYADATHNLGNTYGAMGQATAAGQMFKRALELNPNSLVSAINLAAVDIQLKNFPEAAYALSIAQNINEHSPMVYNGWAIYYFQTGDKEKAIRLLQKALTLDPNYQPAVKNMEILRR